MAITYTNPISGLDLIRTTDYEISEMGRFIYENQKDRGHESSVEDHVGVVERYAKQLPGVVLLKAYDTDTKIDTLAGFRFIEPALNSSRWANPATDDEVGKKYRDWLVSEKVDLDAMWTGHMGVNPSYYRQGITKELSKRVSVEAKRLGLLYKIVYADPTSGWPKKTNQYMSENSIVYSDVDFDTSTNGVAGKMGYLKL